MLDFVIIIVCTEITEGLSFTEDKKEKNPGITNTTGILL